MQCQRWEKRHLVQCAQAGRDDHRGNCWESSRCQCDRVAQNVFAHREQGDAGESQAVQSGYGGMGQTHARTDIASALDWLLAEIVVHRH